jgi:hypothetical protein
MPFFGHSFLGNFGAFLALFSFSAHVYIRPFQTTSKSQASRMSHHSQVKCAAHSSVNFGAILVEANVSGHFQPFRNLLGPLFNGFFDRELAARGTAAHTVSVQKEMD